MYLFLSCINERRIFSSLSINIPLNKKKEFVGTFSMYRPQRQPQHQIIHYHNERYYDQPQRQRQPLPLPLPPPRPTPQPLMVRNQQSRPKTQFQAQNPILRQIMVNFFTSLQFPLVLLSTLFLAYVYTGDLRFDQSVLLSVRVSFFTSMFFQFSLVVLFGNFLSWLVSYFGNFIRAYKSEYWPLTFLVWIVRLAVWVLSWWCKTIILNLVVTALAMVYTVALAEMNISAHDKPPAFIPKFLNNFFDMRRRRAVSNTKSSSFLDVFSMGLFGIGWISGSSTVIGASAWIGNWNRCSPTFDTTETIPLDPRSVYNVNGENTSGKFVYEFERMLTPESTTTSGTNIDSYFVKFINPILGFFDSEKHTKCAILPTVRLLMHVMGFYVSDNFYRYAVSFAFGNTPMILSEETKKSLPMRTLLTNSGILCRPANVFAWSEYRRGDDKKWDVQLFMASKIEFLKRNENVINWTKFAMRENKFNVRFMSPANALEKLSKEYTELYKETLDVWFDMLDENDDKFLAYERNFFTFENINTHLDLFKEMGFSMQEVEKYLKTSGSDNEYIGDLLLDSMTDPQGTMDKLTAFASKMPRLDCAAADSSTVCCSGIRPFALGDEQIKFNHSTGQFYIFDPNNA